MLKPVPPRPSATRSGTKKRKAQIPSVGPNTRFLNLSRALVRSNGAEEGIRTLDPVLGKDVLYR